MLELRAVFEGGEQSSELPHTQEAREAAVDSQLVERRSSMGSRGLRLTREAGRGGKRWERCPPGSAGPEGRWGPTNRPPPLSQPAQQFEITVSKCFVLPPPR